MSGASQSITAINIHDNPSLTQGFIRALVKAGSGARHDCVLHGDANDELEADKMCEEGTHVGTVAAQMSGDLIHNEANYGSQSVCSVELELHGRGSIRKRS
ncbi:hypothetical protein Scep_015134 [Stephania cephalantha]|uniref:Uncharacterized protein n=1 Tax=Stephania cephalantha TaxID=152367 RepID=A0AAP0J4J5_9MAGN